MEHQITLFAGSASRQLGAAVGKVLQSPPGSCDVRRFPDGEVQIEIQQSVRGHDVYLLQATSPPVENNLMELLLLADACRRAGAGRTTAVLPYLGYARQDRRTGRRSLGARVAANILATGGFDRLFLLDAHTAAIEGFFDIPLDHLTAVPVLASAAAASIRENSVVVAPDLGAVKLARAYANHLRAPMAFVHKTRMNGDVVQAHAVIGDVRGRSPLVVDDMLSTGGTLEAAVTALRAAGAVEPISAALTHLLLVGRARDVLERLPLDRVLATDSVALEPPLPPAVEIVSIGPLVAAAIRRSHYDESLADLRHSP